MMLLQWKNSRYGIQNMKPRLRNARKKTVKPREPEGILPWLNVLKKVRILLLKEIHQLNIYGCNTYLSPWSSGTFFCSFWFFQFNYAPLSISTVFSIFHHYLGSAEKLSNVVFTIVLLSFAILKCKERWQKLSKPVHQNKDISVLPSHPFLVLNPLLANILTPQTGG